MQKEYIDVDYTEIDDNSGDKKENPADITINTDPLSALFSGIANVINTTTNSIKEYNMCRQQEETKRAAIKAQLKVELAQINTQKEKFLKALEYKHEINKMFINHEHQKTMKLLDSALSAVDEALQNAKKNNDFTIVIELLKYANNMTEMHSYLNLQLMDKVYLNNSDTATIEINSPKGYLT